MKKIIIPLICLVACSCVAGKAEAQKKGPILNHAAFYVVDLQKSTAFYRDIIRLDTMPEPFHDGKHTWFSVGDHSQFHIIKGATSVTEHDKNTHICFSVPSVEDVMSRLEKAGYTWTNWKGDGKTPTIRTDGVKQIYLQDPDGYWVEINNDKY